MSSQVPAKTSDTLAIYIILRRGMPEGVSVKDMWLKVKDPHGEVRRLRELGLDISQDKYGEDGSWGWRLNLDPWGSTAAAIRALREATT